MAYEVELFFSSSIWGGIWSAGGIPRDYIFVINFFPNDTWFKSSWHILKNYIKVSNKRSYIKELRVELAVLMVFCRLKNCVDYIVSILITDDFSEYFEILEKKLIEVHLRRWRGVTANGTLHHVRRYFLSAVIRKVLTDELSHLKCNLVVIVLQYLLHNVVTKLIIDELA